MGGGTKISDNDPLTWKKVNDKISLNYPNMELTENLNLNLFRKRYLLIFNFIVFYIYLFKEFD